LPTNKAGSAHYVKSHFNAAKSTDVYIDHVTSTTSDIYRYGFPRDETVTVKRRS